MPWWTVVAVADVDGNDQGGQPGWRARLTGWEIRHSEEAWNCSVREANASEMRSLAVLIGTRRDELFEELRARLNELSLNAEGLAIQALAQNEQFVSAALQRCGLPSKKKRSLAKCG